MHEGYNIISREYISILNFLLQGWFLEKIQSHSMICLESWWILSVPEVLGNVLVPWRIGEHSVWQQDKSMRSLNFSTLLGFQWFSSMSMALIRSGQCKSGVDITILLWYVKQATYLAWALKVQWAWPLELRAACGVQIFSSIRPPWSPLLSPPLNQIILLLAPIRPL